MLQSPKQDLMSPTDHRGYYYPICSSVYSHAKVLQQILRIVANIKKTAVLAMLSLRITRNQYDDYEAA